MRGFNSRYMYICIDRQQQLFQEIGISLVPILNQLFSPILSLTIDNTCQSWTLAAIQLIIVDLA